MNNKGFTLLELAVVLLIVGFLSTLAIPSVLQKQRLDTVRNFAEELNWTLEAIRRHYSVTGNFPTSLANMVTASEIPYAPNDPFGGTVTLAANNAATPKFATLTIRNGVAGTEYGGSIQSLVPFATHNLGASLITITINEYMVHLEKEIAYAGIHRDGDVIPKIACFGGMTNHPFAAPVLAQASDNSPLYRFRVWVDDGGATYTVNCKTLGAAGPSESTPADDVCYVQVLEICQ